ncbi:MAG: hypothetical protein A2170_13185 [Deltaproteobacteria bacterium RBG_13_53_10]|nr:MAG: hypothetical protein A2170_13185 [Deltaproteobacteria bacterium RBG_13_53_10]
MKKVGISQGIFFPLVFPNGPVTMFAPAGIPEKAKKVFIHATQKVMEAPQVRAKIENLAPPVDDRSPPEFKKMWEAEYRRAKEIAAKLGLGK